MDACNDPQVLNSQLQSILDTANKALSKDQVRLLMQEIQQTTGGIPRSIGPSDQPRCKTSRCDGTNDSSTKCQLLAPNIDIPSELQAGKFKCGCREWVSLRDETGFTLAPWVAHLLVCKQSNAIGAKPRVATSDIAEDSISKSNSKGTSAASCSKGQSMSDYQEDGHNSVSSILQPTLSSSLEVLQTPLRLVIEAITTEGAVSSIERVRGSDKPPSTHMSCDPTESRPSVATQVIDDYPKQSLSQPTCQDLIPRRRRPNRTEAERIQAFHADPYVAEVEPFRVRCGLCNKWIKLRNNSRYCSIPWKCHREGCTRSHGPPGIEVTSSSVLLQRSLKDSQPHSNLGFWTQGTEDTAGSSTSRQLTALDSSTVSPSVSGNSPNTAPSVPNVPPPSTIHPSLQLLGTGLPTLAQASSSKTEKGPTRLFPSKAPRKSRVWDAEQRRATLQDDPNAEIVEPYRILCALCKKWVKLRPNSTYCSTPWYSHIRRCIHRQKNVNAATESTHGEDSSTPDNMDNSTSDNRGSHCGEIRDLEHTHASDPVDKPVSFSRHQRSSESTPKDPSLSEQPKKRGGRPPKSIYLKTRDNDDDGVASEMSYESEEQ